MLRIAICDSDQEYRKRTEMILFHLLFDVEDVSFSAYEGGEAMVNALNSGEFKADLLILDPCLEDENGLRLLSMLRANGWDHDVIMQTDQMEMALYGYRYQVFDFLQKPVSLRESERVFQRYIKEKISLEDNPAFLTVTVSGCRYRIRLQNIVFFESSGRKVTAVMENESLEFYQKMNELQELLPAGDFFRCHQSYIVRKDAVRGLTSTELLLHNQKRIPVSRRYMSEVQKLLGEAPI